MLPVALNSEEIKRGQCTLHFFCSLDNRPQEKWLPFGPIIFILQPSICAEEKERERERDVPHSLGVRREFGVRPLVRIGNTLAPAREEGGRDEFFSLLMVFLHILQFGQQVYQVHKFGSRAQIPWVQKPVLDMPSVF